MARNRETGVDAKSKDGEGVEEGLSQQAKDDLAAQRAKREAENGDANGNGGGSSAQRGAQAALETGDEQQETGEEDDGQLFVWEQGRKVTLGTLIARGTPVEHAFVFGGKRLKGRGQLMGFDEDSLIVGRGLVDSTKIVPTRDGDEKVTKVTIETHLAMKVIVPADSDEAVGMLAGVLERHGYVKAGEAA